MPEPGLDAKNYMNAEPENDFHTPDMFRREPNRKTEPSQPGEPALTSRAFANATPEFEPTLRLTPNDLGREHRKRFSDREEYDATRRHAMIKTTASVLLAGTILTGLLMFRTKETHPTPAASAISSEDQAHTLQPISTKPSAAFALRPPASLQPVAATKPLPTVVRHAARSSEKPIQTTARETDGTVLLSESASNITEPSVPSRVLPPAPSENIHNRPGRRSTQASALAHRSHRHIAQKTTPTANVTKPRPEAAVTDETAADDIPAGVASANTVDAEVPDVDSSELRPRHTRRRARSAAPEITEDTEQAEIERDPYPQNHRDAGEEGDLGRARRHHPRHRRPPGEDEESDRWIDNLPR